MGTAPAGSVVLPGGPGAVPSDVRTGRWTMAALPEPHRRPVGAPPWPGRGPSAPTGAAARRRWVATGDGRHIELASVWARLGAWVVDSLLLSVGLSLVVWGLAGTGGRWGSRWVMIGGGRWSMLVLVVTAVAGLYEVCFIALRGATPGKSAVGIRVVRLDDGRLPGWGPALIRWGVPAAARRVPVVGWLLWAAVYGILLVDDRRQGIHDRAAGTVVVRA